MSRIIVKDISLWFKDKTCFEHFSTIIKPGSKVLIIGNNGTGKSTLLNIIRGSVAPTYGAITHSGDITFGYVPQTVTDYDTLSGGQRFNKALSQALGIHPDVLMLDEPTNHLDAKNKKSLIKMIRSFQGTLLIVSHDPDIMHLDFDEIWHIEHERIAIFKGNYEAYCQERVYKEKQLVVRREKLHKEKRLLIKAQQKERERASSSRAAHKDERDKTLLGAMKERGSKTVGKQGKKFANIEDELHAGLQDAFVHKKITASFNLNPQRLSSSKAIISITDGTCGYTQPVVRNISFQMKGSEHVAIIGDNASGKSTFLKALLHNPSVTISGQWITPPKNEIGYLDQHYTTLHPHETVMQAIQRVAPQKNDNEVRTLLHSFLFIKPDEWSRKAMHLSGGEKARLSLAQIAAADYYLLLLDEITNNIDLDTRAHIIEVLKGYPGAMIIISHDQAFLDAVAIDRTYEVGGKELKERTF